jgi:hypothetical protein
LDDHILHKVYLQIGAGILFSIWRTAHDLVIAGGNFNRRPRHSLNSVAADVFPVPPPRFLKFGKRGRFFAHAVEFAKHCHTRPTAGIAHHRVHAFLNKGSA